MVGAPFEDTIAALRLVQSGLTKRFPNVRIIVPHLGGTLPFLIQRLDDTPAREQAGIDEPPSRLVKRLWFDTVNSYPAALRCACEAYGADRLMLGTDWPYLVGPKFKRCVTYIEESGLPRTDVEAILDKNAQTLLGIKK
jgi:aminocarboxymuconate-semialdehyde decarboxylase